MSYQFGPDTLVTVIGSMFLSLHIFDISLVFILKTSIGISAVFRYFTSKKQMDVSGQAQTTAHTVSSIQTLLALRKSYLFIKEIIKCTDEKI